MPQAREVSVFWVMALDLMAGAVMTGEGEPVGLLHRADWTRLSMSARVSDGSTVLIAPGRGYRYQAGEYVTGCDGGRPRELRGEDVDEVEGRCTGSADPSRRSANCCARPGCWRAPGLRCGAGPRVRPGRAGCRGDQTAESAGQIRAGWLVVRADRGPRRCRAWFPAPRGRDGRRRGTGGDRAGQRGLRPGHRPGAVPAAAGNPA